LVLAAVAKIHERIANRRRNFAHQESRKLVNQYQIIVFEALAPMEMGKRNNSGVRKASRTWHGASSSV
jgi:putative transposase